MVQYRKLPHGDEMISTIGLGLGNIHVSGPRAVEEAVGYAVDRGINYFDLCCGSVDTFRAFGAAVSGRREKIYTQMHFGAVYPKGTYQFSRNEKLIKSSFEKVLSAAGLGYTDFGYLHCVDEKDDLRDLMRPGGIWDYMCGLKRQGMIHHLGFSSHTAAIARELMETGMVDMFMFSINPVYDYTNAGYGETGNAEERMDMYREAEKRGIGITVMKPFAGGQLLSRRQSPLGIQLSRTQCIQYALDKPGVMCVLPGVGSVNDVKEILRYYNSSAEERDYSVLGSAVPDGKGGRCVYCNHCSPCPKGIDIGLVNKYYDLAKIGDKMAAAHYRNLSVHADACVKCGHCESRCPFGVKQESRMEEIKEYFSSLI